MKHKDIKFCAAMAFFFVALLLALSAHASPGDIHTFAGTGIKGNSGNGGPAAAADLSNPYGVAVDVLGNVYFSDGPNQAIRKVDASGKITKIVGSGGGSAAAQAGLKNPSGVCVDASGNIYIADSFNDRIRKVTSSGSVSTVAGTGQPGYAGDGGPAAAASLRRPYGVAADASGNLYIADSYNNVVRRVAPNGIITTVAGTGAAGYSGDGGPAVKAQLNRPESLALDASGNLYIADTFNSVVRKVGQDGTVTTVAGNGVKGFSGDGGPAASASLNMPTGVAMDASGDLFISDFGNQRVRLVGSSGIITTYAGMGTASGGGDEGPAASAGLNCPFGLATDASGNLYIADSGNFKVRMVEGASYSLPTSAITSPGNGTAVGPQAVSVTGTASAANGVAFVEVSTDGGQTWSQATGTTSWNYSWTPKAGGAYVLLSRATDSAGKTGTIMGYAKVKINISGAASQPGNGGQAAPQSAAAAQAAAPVTAAAAAPGIYGPGIQSVSLQETAVGKYASNVQCGLRFRARHTGSIASVLQYLIWSTAKSGYNAGTGGSAFRVELRADDGSSSHLPSSQVLASTTYANPMQGSHFPVIQFDSPAQVQKGQIYHIVYTNLDSDPASNWCSVDNLIGAYGKVTKPLQPGLGDIFAVEAADTKGGPWRVRDDQTPIYQVNYTDGSTQGMGYMEVMADNPHVVSGSSMVRETFTVSGANRTVTGMSVKLNRSSGSGDLVFRLESGDGSGIQEVSAPASSVPSDDTWVTASFAQPVVLKAGQSYNLALKTDASTTYSVYTVERGDHYGFDTTTYFKDGYAQFTTGSGWTGWTKAGGAVTNLLDTDLQFYFNAQ